MSAIAEKLLEDALRLPDRDRADMATSLIDSLDRHFDEGAQAAWDLEIARRVAELDSHSVKPIPWPEARRLILDQPDGSPDS